MIFYFQSVTLVSILAARRHRHGGTAKVSTAGTAASSGMPVATAEGRGGSEGGGDGVGGKDPCRPRHGAQEAPGQAPAACQGPQVRV